MCRLCFPPSPPKKNKWEEAASRTLTAPFPKTVLGLYLENDPSQERWSGICKATQAALCICFLFIFTLAFGNPFFKKQNPTKLYLFMFTSSPFNQGWDSLPGCSF